MSGYRINADAGPAARSRGGAATRARERTREPEVEIRYVNSLCQCLRPLPTVVLDDVLEIGCHRCGRLRSRLTAADLDALRFAGAAQHFARLQRAHI